MLKSREEIQKALGMAEPPDDELMALLDELGDGEVVTGVRPAEGDGYTADELAEELEEAVVADSVGELLRKAREEVGHSLRDTGEAVGVSHSRIRELEHSSNIEVATLARVAGALGYSVSIVLTPQTPVGRVKRIFERKRRLTAEL